jgi:predicted transcriptional regulator
VEQQSSQTEDGTGLIGLAADIVSAYVTHNSLPAGDLTGLINTVHSALNGIATGGTAAGGQAEAAVTRATAAQIKKSITPDALTSFEDGKQYKSLKRHLTIRGMTPQQYREKWGLPATYPMVSPNYAAQRSDLAKNGTASSALGRCKRRSLVSDQPSPVAGRRWRGSCFPFWTRLATRQPVANV